MIQELSLLSINPSDSSNPTPNTELLQLARSFFIQRLAADMNSAQASFHS